MRRQFITADVFTDQPFGGNPLAVLPHAAGLSTEQMQRIGMIRIPAQNFMIDSLRV